MARAMDNSILETIVQQVRPLIGQGKVADYIPALASVDGSKLGIAICTVDGQHYQAGDAQERFSIQSISKVLSLVVAMRHYQEEEIWQRVGKDPSGHPFNSLVQLEMEQGIPRNPFINAGALVVCDMLQGRLSAPRQRMLEVVRALSGVSDIAYDATVARSEFEHSARNAAIAWLMKSFGNFHHDVPTVLQNYFHYCALKMSCVELARTFVFLANQGACLSSCGACGHSDAGPADQCADGDQWHVSERRGICLAGRASGEIWCGWRRRGDRATRDGDCCLESGTGSGGKFTGRYRRAGAINTTAGALGLLMKTLDPLFARLAKSTFRSRFRLGQKERQYCLDKGAPVIEQHAADFIAKRLAPAFPANDGKQTPMRGHPVFIAQHATATCCRGCLAKWHDIPQGVALNDEQQRYVVTVIYHWLVLQMNKP